MPLKSNKSIESQFLPDTVASVDLSKCEFISDSFFDSADLSETSLPLTLGRYTIEKEIARGGMGVILLAHDSLLRRYVAIKLLLSRYTENSSLLQRFVNEALITSRLQHPCIVPIYDHGHAEDHRPYFTMKLITGLSLSEILQEPVESHPDRSRLLKIFEQVCLAIAYAHSEGVLHLDLKPANIMVGEFGEVYVMDWGLSRALEPVECLEGHDPAARSGIGKHVSDSIPYVGIHGTPAYMPPEQAQGLAVCVQSDVFGLGALLCEILTGRSPYRDRDVKKIYTDASLANLDDAHQRLDACAGDERLVQLAKRCLAPNLMDRPLNASLVAAEISGYLESALEQGASDLSRFFDLDLDFFCIATSEGYFRRINRNFSLVLGYTEKELTSRPFVNFIHPDDVAETIQIMCGLLEGKPVHRFKNRYRHKDGHFITLEWTAKSIVAEDTIFAVAREVTSSST